MKTFIALCMFTLVVADVKHITDRNLDLFKYNPGDIYTLPEDIDDEKPAVVFFGDIMKAKVEKFDNFNGNKKFKLDLKTQNGIEVTSVGKLKDDKTFVVSGSYSFTGADGKRYKTRYTADELGYHPITELDLDIPEPQAQSATSNQFFNDFGGLAGPNALKNRFQFLNKNLNSENQQLLQRGSGQSGYDYNYSQGNDFGNNLQNGYGSNPGGSNGAQNGYYSSNPTNGISSQNSFGNGQYNNYYPAGASGSNPASSSSFNQYAAPSAGGTAGGYDYAAPNYQFNNEAVPTIPSRQYLPSQ